MRVQLGGLVVDVATSRRRALAVLRCGGLHRGVVAVGELPHHPRWQISRERNHGDAQWNVRQDPARLSDAATSVGNGRRLTSCDEQSPTNLDVGRQKLTAFLEYSLRIG